MSEEQQSQEELVNLDQLKAGYTVGITEDGKFVFNVHGQELTIVELEGVHKYATARVEREFDRNQNRGDALVLQLGQILVETNKKLDKLLEANNTQTSTTVEQ